MPLKLYCSGVDQFAGKWSFRRSFLKGVRLVCFLSVHFGVPGHRQLKLGYRDGGLWVCIDFILAWLSLQKFVSMAPKKRRAKKAAPKRRRSRRKSAKKAAPKRRRRKSAKKGKKKTAKRRRSRRKKKAADDA